MDRVGATRLRGVEDQGGVQVAGRRRCWAEADCDVGRSHKGGVAIGIGIDRDGLEPLVMTGADDAQGNLAPVGHQDASDGTGGHRGQAVIAGSPCASGRLKSDSQRVRLRLAVQPH